MFWRSKRKQYPGNWRFCSACSPPSRFLLLLLWRPFVPLSPSRWRCEENSPLPLPRYQPLNKPDFSYHLSSTKYWLWSNEQPELQFSKKEHPEGRAMVVRKKWERKNTHNVAILCEFYLKIVLKIKLKQKKKKHKRQNINVKNFLNLSNLYFIDPGMIIPTWMVIWRDFHHLTKHESI